MRGPGNAKVGYCGLTTTSDGTIASTLTLRAATRAASAVPVQVLINPTGVAVHLRLRRVGHAGTYKVVSPRSGRARETLTGALPAVAPACTRRRPG